MKQTKWAALAIIVLVLTESCSRVQPNYEGVLMKNYGRNGIGDFTLVTGSQGILWWDEALYQAPMYEQQADPPAIKISSKEGGVFTVDPSLTYQAQRGRGVNIIFNYKHVGIGDRNTIMDNIEAQVLNNIVVNAYREEARRFTTDSLMNNLNTYEETVEARLKAAFEKKYFTLLTLTSGLTPPKSMAQAIEDRNNAKQRTEQARNELATAQIGLEKARIEAETNKVRTSGLSKENLTEQWIEAIRETQNKVIITDGKTPLIMQP